MFPSRALAAAAGETLKYHWHDVTNPAYNTFFHKTFPKIQTVVTTAGSLYGAYLLLTQPAQR